MGRWFAEFMASQGFAVEIADPTGAPPGFAHLPDWRTSPLNQDFIVIATPLGVTDKILRELAMRRPKGVIFDVGSLKSPLRAGLNALKSHGCRVASLHPMLARTRSCSRAGTSSSSRRARRRQPRRRANCSRPPWWNRL